MSDRVRGRLRYWHARIGSGLRRVGAGLPPGGERVWPGVRNDLFVAHRSLYVLFGRWTRDADVVDAACGTGYGSALLACEARSVLGIDRNRASIRYARRHYRVAGLRFEVGDCERMALAPASFDVVVCSNAMEHFREPARFLANARTALRGAGVLLLAIPPILGERSLADNERNPYHVSNLAVDEWLELFERESWSVELYRHCFGRPGMTLDFASPFESAAAEGDFELVRSTYEEFCRQGSITGVYHLRPRAQTPCTPGSYPEKASVSYGQVPGSNGS